VTLITLVIVWRGALREETGTKYRESRGSTASLNLKEMMSAGRAALF